MLNKILSIPLSVENLTDGFILVNEIRKLEYNKYVPMISAFRLNKKTFELTINKADLFSQPIISLNEILKVFPNIEMPNPIKTYSDIKISLLLHDSEQSQEINEIKNQLRHYLYSDVVTLENINYLIEVDKSVENYISYYLYEPDEYRKFEDVLNKELLNICYEWNKEEYFRLLKRIEEVQKYSKSESAEKTMKYLDEVRFRFDEWFRFNNYSFLSNNKTEGKKTIVNSRRNSSKRKNWKLLYPKYIEANIRLKDKFKRFPKQKEIAKYLNEPETAISRLVNKKEHLQNISLLMIEISKGKNELPHFKHLDENHLEILSEFIEEFTRNKYKIISK
ncbi:MAG: hypothetical protein GYA14_06335 [Ignavibacteria bacterium]|nr:hypothetical protein [Ignavibacteria bacterium]